MGDWQVAAAKEESHKLEEQLNLGAVRLKQARLEGNQLQAQVVEVRIPKPPAEAVLLIRTGHLGHHQQAKITSCSFRTCPSPQPSCLHGRWLGSLKMPHRC